MKETGEGDISISTENSSTLSSMIHYIYTRELAGGWQDLDILDVARAADMYDLPGWMELFRQRMERGEMMNERQLADMAIAKDIFAY